MNKSRDRYIDFLRGAAILLVVYAHAIQSCNAMDSHNPIHIIIQTFQMSMLMMISGYCSNYSEPPKSIKLALFKKISRLLIPYLLWEQIHYLLKVFINKYDYTLIVQIVSVFTSKFWFLRILFLIYLGYLFFFGVTEYLLKSYKREIQLMGGVIAVIVTILLFSRIPGCSSVISYSFMFLIGNLALKLRKRIGKAIFLHICIVGCFCFIVSCVLYFNTNGILLFVLDKSMAITGTMFFAVLTRIIFKSVKNEKLIKEMSKIGTATLSIYSIHWCLLFDLNLFNNYEILVSRGINIYLAALIIFTIWLTICLILISIYNLLKHVICKRILYSNCHMDRDSGK